MPIKSMTGFSRVEQETPLGHFVIELKSVNSRFLDFSYKAPYELRQFELATRASVSESITRGKVECHVRLQRQDAAIQHFNEPLIQAYIQASDALAEKYNKAKPSLDTILQLPEVIKTESVDADMLKQYLLTLLEDALKTLIDERSREGAVLAEGLKQRLDDLQAHLEAIKVLAKANPDRIKQSLLNKVETLKLEVDESRFEQELLYLLNKADIEEEIDRLSLHIEAANDLLQAKKPVGRRFDFLLQEMNRETNTIASKANIFSIQTSTVEMKVLLEQMREQAQNIE